MKSLREQYQDLDRAVNDRYRELINSIGRVLYYDPEQNEEDDDLYDLEVVTHISRNGENLDVKVLEISKDSGIYVVSDDDDSKRYWIGLNDLADLGDKIQITTLLENELI